MEEVGTASREKKTEMKREKQDREQIVLNVRTPGALSRRESEGSK